jgi:hypothetical protein
MTNTIKDDDIISNIRKDKLNNINNLTQILRKDTESTLDSQMENSQKNSNENLPFVNLTPILSFEDDENQKIILNIPEKTNPLRLNYYSKLIQNGIWYKEKMKNSFNSLFILDWDDTLFCTSEVANLNDLEDNNNLSQSQKVKFSKLEKEVKKILQKCIEKGETYIITNSEPGWVQYSCQKYFPSIIGLLDQLNIISARGLYENQFPFDSYMWKINAFNDIVNLYNPNLLSNIMCIGDSFSEIQACKNLSNIFKNAFIKTIKFKENPSIDELILEIKLVNDKFLYIYSAVKNWTINVKRNLKK